jgi:phosphotriesterase-related protein
VTQDMVGKVMTVRGPIAPDELGFTLMHEHLFIDLRRFHLPHPLDVTVPGRSQPVATTEDFPATELAMWEAPLTTENLRLAQEGGAVSDQWVLADESLAVEETLGFKNRGGGTIVDVTSIGLKRDPEALRRVSVATGLHIVMGAGWYQKVFHPDDMDRRTVEDLTQEIIGDVTSGVGETGVRSGIIGEVGVNGDPITPNEEKSIRASARASVITGAAITFHEAGLGAEKHDVLDMVEQEGGDLSRVVISHCNSIATDVPFMIELLERGVYVEFELLGQAEALGVSVTKQAAEAVPRLIDTGYRDRVMLAQDVCVKTHLKHYGGPGFSYLQETFIPHLKTLGLTPDDIERIFVENPRRVLTFVDGTG